MPNHYPVGTIVMEEQNHRRKIGVVIGLRKNGKFIHNVKWMLEGKYYGEFEYFKDELEKYTIVGYSDDS
jgi:hypothetical protein